MSNAPLTFDIFLAKQNFMISAKVTLRAERGDLWNCPLLVKKCYQMMFRKLAR